MKMKESLNEQEPEIKAAVEEGENEFERSAPVNPDFTLTQGARSDLRQQLQPLQEELKNRTAQEKLEHKYANPNTVVQEDEDEAESDFARSPKKVHQESLREEVKEEVEVE